MTVAEQLAHFVVRASWEDLTDLARYELKVRVLDSLGCAIGALDQGPLPAVKAVVDDFGGRPVCTMIGGGRTSPDRAAFYNSALVRYLDFNDSYLAKGETCHPSDNLGAVLAASEYRGQSGADLLVALAVAYQVQCRLCDVAPVRNRGFDHTTQGSFAVAAGVAKALGLDANKTANAISIAGTAFNALRVTRTGSLSHWKGLAYANTCFGATHAAFLAMRGVTGPSQVFEGNKGFMESIAGNFTIDWTKENLDRVQKTILKKYNAEVHSQSAIEAIIELKNEYSLTGHEVERVEVDIFDVAYHIIGGGDEGDKTVIHTKEEADHSLPYLLAVALLDGQVMPEQFTAKRILKKDVQRLLERVKVRSSAEFSRRFPKQHCCQLRLYLGDGRVVERKKRDYEGFVTRPMPWQSVVKKFEILSLLHVSPSLSRKIVQTVEDLEKIKMTELTKLLGNVHSSVNN